MQYTDIPAMDIGPLKDELIDTVSACLISEPRYESARISRDGEGSDLLPASQGAGSTVDPNSDETAVHESADNVDVKEQPSSSNEDTIGCIRLLVHTISAHDGEFVLKLALYVRHTLNIRKTANFLAALCAREPKCVPFLSCYLERIVHLPTDWLSVANFAYYHDSDWEHQKFDTSTPSIPSFSQLAKSNASVTAPFNGGGKFTTAGSLHAFDATRKQRASPSSQQAAIESAAAAAAATAAIKEAQCSRLPNALRRSLVACFGKFDEFQIAKYNNESAEKKRRWKQKQKMKAQNIEEEDDDDSDSTFEVDRYESGESDSDWGETRGSSTKAATARALPVRKTFTFKQLVRMLHISFPPYVVCCLLGKRYPANVDEFKSLGLAVGARIFDPDQCGRRMRLPVPETWETRIAKDGNTGATWDDLVAKGKLPFMATLRNLRNLMKHNCSSATHETVLARLASEEQVSASRQFPYRFYSAYDAVKAVTTDYNLRTQMLAKKCKEQEKAEEAWRKRRRGVPFSAKVRTPLTVDEINTRRRCKFEEPVLSFMELGNLTARYTHALDRAVAISTSLNIIPMKGSSIVFLRIQSGLFDKISPAAGGAVGSLRTKLEVASLLVAMMLRACEDCTVVLHSGTTDRVLNAEEVRGQSVLEDVEKLVRASHEVFSLGHSWSNGERVAVRFPYWYLDRVIERCITIESLMVIDEEHHTYSAMNVGAPSLGDLPVYLARMRRTSSEQLVFVGLSVSPAAKNNKRNHGHVSDAVSGDFNHEKWKEKVNTNSRERYVHRNDILLTGFSDAVLRFVAERAHGGPRVAVERMDTFFNVNRASAMAHRYAADEGRRALRAIHTIERAHQENAAATLPPAFKAAAAAGSGGTGTDLISATGSVMGLSPATSTAEMMRGSLLPLTSTGGSSNVFFTRGSASITSFAGDVQSMLQEPLSLPPLPVVVGRGSTNGSVVATSSAQFFEKNATVSLRPEFFHGVSAPATASSPAATEFTTTNAVAAPALIGKARKPLTELLAERYTESSEEEDKEQQEKVFSALVLQRRLSTLPTAPTIAEAASAEEKRKEEEKQQQQQVQGRQQDSCVSPPLSCGRLLSSYRQCRFFISSTFLDMDNERSTLVLDVFPRLRRWAAGLGLKVALIEVDLRWGITAAASAENLSTSVCLNEVSRCAPFFIGMLGDRYGRPPSPLQVVPSVDVDPSDYDWLTKELPMSADGKVSVTELEMRHGMRTAQKRLAPGQAPSVVFFKRNGTKLLESLPADERRAVYEPDAPTSRERIDELVKFIEAQDNVPLIEYTATFAGIDAVASSTCGVGGRGAARGTDAAGVANVVFPDATSLSFPTREDDGLGSWGVRPPSATIPSATTGALARTLLPARGSATGIAASNALAPSSRPSPFAARTLTSESVPLDMRDFAVKAFFALKAIVSNVCGVPLAVHTRDEDEQEKTERENEEENGEKYKDGMAEKQSASGTAHVSLPLPTSASMIEPAGGSSAEFYSAVYGDLHAYMNDLFRHYVAPRGFIEKLAGFALSGTLMACEDGAATEGRDSRSQSSAATTATAATGKAAPSQASTSASRRLTTSGLGAKATQHHLDLPDVVATSSGVLLVEGAEGDGKSSAIAAVAHHLFEFAADSIHVVYYTTQAGDGSLRSLVLFIVISLVYRVGLQDEFSILESDTVPFLLQLLPRIYEAIKKKKASVVVLLDGLDSSLEKDEILRNLGWIVSATAVPEVRFIISSSAATGLVNTLLMRSPPAHVLSIPDLSIPERAELVRKHLAKYGKQLQETLEVNEIRSILRKHDSSHACYLTAMITHLRLFSTFDTLRADIHELPGTVGQLYVKFFRELEKRFDKTICRLVLTTLYLWQASGGIMEYNLYRLVSSVATASRVIALLNDTCLHVRHGRIMITSRSFEAAIANAYLSYPSDRVQARENAIAAELLYRPLSTSRDPHENRATLRAVVESIRLSTLDSSLGCVFRPERYSPHELFGILQSAVQAGRDELVVALATYLPFIENLLKDAAMLQRYISVLWQVCTSNKQVEAKLLPAVLFLQRQYHVLSQRPELICQCVRNTPDSFTAISKYSTADMAYASAERRHESGGGATEKDVGAELDEITVLKPSGRTNAEGGACILNPQTTEVAFSPSSAPVPLDTAEHGAATVMRGALHVLANTTTTTNKTHNDHWVKWMNVSHHGSENRISIFNPSSHTITCMDISSGSVPNRYVAFGCTDYYARVSPVDSPEQVTSVLRHTAAVTAMAFVSNHDDVLVTGCERGVLYVWCVRDGSLLQMSASQHLRAISSVTCHPNEAFVCTGGLDTYTMLWDLLGTTSSISIARSEHRLREEGQQQQRQLGEISTGLRKKGSKAAGGGKCGRDGSSLSPTEVLRHHKSPVACVAFHGSGEVLATGAWDGKLFFTRLGIFQESPQLSELIMCATPSAIFKPLRSLEEEQAEQEYHELPYEHYSIAFDSPVRVLAFMPSLVVTCVVGLYDGTIALVDHAAGGVSALIRTLHSSPLSAIRCSPDGKLIASADEHGVLRLTYAGVTGTRLCTLNGHRGAITALSFMPDAPSELWTSGADKSVQTWFVSADEPPVMPTSHSTTVTCVAVSGDGSMLVTGCADGMVFVFARRRANDDNYAGTGGSYATMKQHQRAWQTRVGPTAEAEAAVLEPSIVLSHDESRVSAIALALYDTRIVVGVAFGHVYVWSASPGLNRTEGRLLLCVRAPTHCMYPIIAIESTLLLDNSAVSGSERGFTPGVREESAKGRDKEGCADAGAAAMRFENDEDAAADKKASTAHVSALCSNGETITFHVYSDAVSMALHHLMEDEMALSTSTAGESRLKSALFANDAEDSGGSTPRLKSCASTMQWADSGNWNELMQVNVNDTDEEKGENALSYEEEEEEELPSFMREMAVDGSSHSSSTESTTAKDSHNTSGDDAEQQRAKEAYHQVQRQLLKWTAPVQTYARVPVADHTELKNEVSSGSSQRRQEDGASKRRMWSGDSIRNDLRGAQRGHHDRKSEEDAHAGLLFGEEIIASTPLSFMYGRDMPPVSASATPRPSSSKLAVHDWRKKSHARLHIQDHFSLLVGLKHFYVASHKDGYVGALSVQVDADYCSSADGLFRTEFTLSEDEVFISVSSRLAPVPSSLSHDTCGGVGNGEKEGLLAATTNEGNVYIFLVQHRRSNSNDNNTGSVGTPSSAAASQTRSPSHPDVGTYGSTARGSSLHGCPTHTTVTLWHELRVWDHRPDGSEKVMVDATDIYVCPVPTLAEPSAAEARRASVTMTMVPPPTHTVYLLLGCRDGTTRLLSCRYCPQSASAPSSPMNHSVMHMVKEAGQRRRATSTVSLKQKQTKFTTLYEQRGSGPNATSGCQQEQHTAFMEEAIFFCTASLTALSILSPPTSACGHSFYPQWVAGDSLGNVYQLRVEDETGERNRSSGSWRFQKPSAALSGIGPYRDALSKLAMCSPGAVGEAGPSALSSNDRAVAGWAWASRSPLDWLKRVDVDRGVLNIGNTLTQQRVAAPSLSFCEQKRSDTAAEVSNRKGVVGQDKGQAFADYVDKTLKMHPGASSGTLMLSLDAYAGAPLQARAGAVDDKEFHFLPSLSVLSTTRGREQQSQPSSLSQEQQQHSRKSHDEHYSSFSAAVLDGNPVPSTSALARDAHAMAATLPRTSVADTSTFPHVFMLDAAATTENVATVASTAVTLAEEEHRVASLFMPFHSRTAAKMPEEGEGGEVESAVLARHPLKSTERKPMPGSTVKLTFLAPQEVPRESMEPEIMDDGGAMYFSILYSAVPPLELPAQEKKKWLLNQQMVAREAARVQKYNGTARKALEAYTTRAMKNIGGVMF